MRLAILADIHGNVLALEAVLTDLEHRRVDEVVNLRDCVSGPLWPRETAQLLMGLDWRTVRGNHDRWVTDWLPEQHYASDAFAFRELDAAQLAWLRVDGIVMPPVPSDLSRYSFKSKVSDPRVIDIVTRSDLRNPEAISERLWMIYH
jgi:Calcineurin-like phosphoesterase superfamily domain